MVILINAKEAAVITGYHALSLRRFMRNGDFPTAIYVKQGHRGVLHFQKIEVEAGIAARAASKTAKRVAQAGGQVAA